MARPNVPACKEALNLANTKVSYLVVSTRRLGFELPTGTNKKLVVTTPIPDENNSPVRFTARVVSNTKKRAIIKLIADTPGVAIADILDGLLSITFSELDAVAGSVTEIAIADVPVDYVND